MVAGEGPRFSSSGGGRLRVWVRLVDENGIVRYEPCRAYVGYAAGLWRFAGAGTGHLYCSGGRIVNRGARPRRHGDDLMLITAADASTLRPSNSSEVSTSGSRFFILTFMTSVGPGQPTHVQEWDRTSLFKTSATDIPLVGGILSSPGPLSTQSALVDANAELRRPPRRSAIR